MNKRHREEKEEEVVNLRHLDVFELLKLLVEKLEINEGKIDRLKDVSATSHSSIVSPENILSMLQPNEQERKYNVEQWFKKVRKVFIAFLTKLAEKHPSDSMDIYSFVHFMQSIHPPVFLDRPPSQNQQDLPDENRCIALCDGKVRCFRQRHHLDKKRQYFCTFHRNHVPFGVDEKYKTMLGEEASCSSSSGLADDETFELPLRLINYRGFFVYIDLLNNNVYYTEDIYQKKTNPRIIGKYKVYTDDDTLEEKYIIPAIDETVVDSST